MSPPKSHLEMQKSLCIVCFKKQKTLRNISARAEITIKELVLPGFGTDEWDWLPTSICGGCYKELYVAKNNPGLVPLYSIGKHTKGNNIV